MDARSRADCWTLLGVPVSLAPLTAIVAACLASRPPAARPVTVACANLHCLVVASRDTEFAAALRAASFVTADGAPLLVAGRFCGEAVGERITGSELFTALMARLEAAGGRAMFVGSTPTVLARIRERAARESPNVTVATLSPPFGTPTIAEECAAVAAINAFRPDVLWVGMSAPKQEKWMARHAASLDARAIVCVGAVFDFYAGTVPRAPAWMRRAGFEWLHRLASEPRRLWRRYLVSGPVFVSLVLRDRWIRSTG